MEASLWLPLQAIGTMAIVIGLAYWSWRRTRKMKDRGEPHEASALARDTPDPHFKPDPEVTDPSHVTSAHQDGEPRTRGREDRAPNDGAPNDGAPNDGAPNDGAPNEGAPKEVAPDTTPRSNRETTTTSANEAQDKVKQFKAR